MTETTIRIRTKQLHRDTGEIVPAVVVCRPGKPLEILSFESPADIGLADNVHVALARCDPHVHARESVVPTRDEFERLRVGEESFEETIRAVQRENQGYDVYRASLAALKAGIWLIGCMGNTPWAPVGYERWRQTGEQYRRHSLVHVHVWPRMEPGVEPIVDQETKDFGSTFGGSGLSQAERDTMYARYANWCVSYHNDQARPDENLVEFFRHNNGPIEKRFHLYFDEQTVLASQTETIALARKHRLASLLTRHIPTGRALQLIIDEQSKPNSYTLLPAEIGLDYLYWNRDMVVGHPTGLINYRRPALPSAVDQAWLINLTRSQTNNPLVHLASDHAPHRPEDKAFHNGLPGRPGTRLLELSTQLHTHLVQAHGFSWADIDRLSAIHPALYMARYLPPFPYPAATMTNGAMANLCIFDPDTRYCVDEAELASQLADPYYHSAYREAVLPGQVLFTVINGRVWDVIGAPKPVNG